MPAINKIHITGFKAFPNDFELELEGKHLLMYGENGSGKSSIYYALHCIFQSPFKSDAGKKYFDIESEQHLKNIYNLEADSKIWIDFEGRKHSKKCTFYTLRFGCSFAAVNTIKPQLL